MTGVQTCALPISLPTHFDHLVTMLMYWKETVVLDKVTSALLSHIKMKLDDNGS